MSFLSWPSRTRGHPLPPLHREVSSQPPAPVPRPGLPDVPWLAVPWVDQAVYGAHGGGPGHRPGSVHRRCRIVAMTSAGAMSRR